MSNTINIGYYFVAFIDIVGQRDKLNQLISLPQNDAEKQHIVEVLVETSEYVKQLRGDNSVGTVRGELSSIKEMSARKSIIYALGS